MCYEENCVRDVTWFFDRFHSFCFSRLSTDGGGRRGKGRARVDPDSLSELVESLEFLSKAGSFSFTAEVEYDALQGNGERIEFGGVNKIAVVRPDKLHAEITERDGTKKMYVLDGKDIYYADLEQNVYASVPRPGNINQAVDYLTEDLQMPLPLGQLISSDVSGMVKKEIYAGGFVEQSTINGVLCDHLAFRQSPCRVVIKLRLRLRRRKRLRLRRSEYLNYIGASLRLPLLMSSHLAGSSSCAILFFTTRQSIAIQELSLCFPAAQVGRGLRFTMTCAHFSLVNLIGVSSLSHEAAYGYTINSSPIPSPSPQPSPPPQPSPSPQP